MWVAIDRLEPRLCLSATLGSDGVLAVTGSDLADNIRVIQRDGTILVSDSDGAFTFDAALVDEVTVAAGGGNDRVRLDRLAVPSSIDGGAGNDVLTGSDDDDTITGGEGNDRIRGRGGDDDLSGDAGNDRISGDAGDDTLAGGAGSDRLEGGAGFDEADLAVDSIDGSPDVFRGIEFSDGLVDDILVPAPIAPGLTRGDFPTTTDITGVTPTSGPPDFAAAAPGFQPVNQPLTFPGYSTLGTSGSSGTQFAATTQLNNPFGTGIQAAGHFSSADDDFLFIRISGGLTIFASFTF